MYQARHRRGRSWSSNGHSRRMRRNLFLFFCAFVLVSAFGAILVLQTRLPRPAEGVDESIDSPGKKNGFVLGLDAIERDERLLREGQERGIDLEREWRDMVAEEFDDSTDGMWSEDELEAESRLNEAPEKDNEEEGSERIEEVDTEMDMEDEDVEEFESFAGDVGEWLNEVDEFSGKKTEADEDRMKQKSGKYSVNSAEGLKFETQTSIEETPKSGANTYLRGGNVVVSSEIEKMILKANRRNKLQANPLSEEENMQLVVHAEDEQRSQDAEAEPQIKKVDAGSSGGPSGKDKKKAGKLQRNGDKRRWGFFPGLDPKLTFTGFMEEFLFDEKCGLRVFMSWMTPEWSFTVRHQRVLESLFHFHPDACVVVFSETIDLDFFNKSGWVKDGYRIAVAMPQLEELLQGTPSEDFAKIYLQWREVDLFYIHYTELLRLAALYKYGGMYLDTDMIVVKPLNTLHNTLGSEVLSNGHTRPNGAALFFERFSPFLNACMVEFTATYDETEKEGNGAALLDRVINGSPDADNELRPEVYSSYSLQNPFAFFPLNATNILRYFLAPDGDDSHILQQEDDRLFDEIMKNSYMVHLKDSMTGNTVPQEGSLVNRIMDRNCLRCLDIL